MNTSTLSQTEFSELEDIHKKLIPKRKKQFQTYSIVNFKKTKTRDAASLIVNKSVDILKQNGISNFNKNKFYIEFHKRNSGFEKKDFGNWFIWHEDDNAAVNYLCYTVIFYLRKDHTLKGGNLLYKLNGKECVQTIKTGDILQFKGDIEHCPEPVTGFGCRDIIVVFIKRTKE